MSGVSASRRPAGPVTEPVQGRFAYLDYPGVLALSGFEQIQRFHRRQLPYGPLWYLTGLDLVEFGVGTATFRLPATGWLHSAAGVLTGGALAFVADGALGSAILSTLPPGQVMATSDLMLNFVRPPAADCAAIIARARVIEVGRSQALSEATVDDAAGHLLAHATSRCLIIEVPGPLPAPPEGPVPWPDEPRPHPFERPPQGQVIPQELWDRMDGIEMQHAWLRGELPRTPLSNLLGTELQEVEEGTLTLAMPASRWFCNTGGTLYGGLLALLADYGLHGAIHTTAPAGTSWATLDLKVRFLRPVLPDGPPVQARTRLIHRGRRMAVASAEITTAQGKVAALTDTSAILLPDRPWRTATAPLDETIDLDEPG